jgi:predicted dithiol-disulfide oxidoreductase (DUF899 family)
MTAATAEAATTSTIPNHRSADRWIAERRALLAREKELVRLRDEIARARRAIALGVCRAFDTLAWPRSAPRILAAPVE